MERFAFKIDAALKANLYKICRLCGIDNPSKVPILPNASDDATDMDEPSLVQKVFELVGFVVSPEDKMPQTMCSLCVEKINDFYEFREMCFTTNNQTRKLLGLHSEDVKKVSNCLAFELGAALIKAFLAQVKDVKPIFESQSPAVAPGNKRGRKRKSEEITLAASCSSAQEMPLEPVKSETITWRKKQRLQPQQAKAGKIEIKKEPYDEDKVGAAAKKARKVSCTVCGEHFKSRELAEAHKTSQHVPFVPRYACYACSQHHQRISDIKAHQIWHKLSKTPYECPVCNASVANIYALKRHMREHTAPRTPIELLVLDRECPVCKKTFLTNYFYNTHPCARRTRTCGGCNRPFINEIGLMRHAPHCAKIYLNHSKHILPEVTNNEAQMRVKNEFGGDHEEDMFPTHTLQQDEDKVMQPVVVLERLASPLLRASTVSNSLGKSSERVSTKSYMKRVDQLLKNTMSTLVSIKHEPEVHINDTDPPLAAEEPDSAPDEDLEPEPEPEPEPDDFHADASYDDSDEEVATTSAGAIASAAAEQSNASAVAIKQELIDEAYENGSQQQMLGGAIKQEPFKLKLKITKNDGQLNSSLIDDEHGDHVQGQSKSTKRKKKRKHRERNKDSDVSDMPTDMEPYDSQEKCTEQADDEASGVVVNIKQERPDNSYSEEAPAQAGYEPQATVMTSIPILQLQSSYNECNPEMEPQDVKPNRLELDRLMQITHIASGVVMAEEAMPPESAVEAVPSDRHISPTSTSVASDDTRATGTAADSPIDEVSLPKIMAVESAASMAFNIVAIKPEPLNRGYMDESEPCEEEEEEEEVAESRAMEAEEERAISSNEINHNKQKDEEAAYIDSLNLSNVIIKQEKDLHISDVELENNATEMDNSQYNGLRESRDTDEDEDEDDADDSASSADEAEENMDTIDDQEERIYREIELPPLEEECATVEPAQQVQNQAEMTEVPACVEHENLIHSQSISEIPLQHRTSREASPAPEPQAVCNEPEQTPLEVPSGSHFGFVITNVCSKAELLPSNEETIADKSPPAATEIVPPEALGKCIDGEDNISCPVLTLSAPKENETMAQPFSEPPATTNYNSDEEQQNVLNHELSAVAPVEEQPEAGPSNTSCSSRSGNDEPSASEETENRINEQQQERQQQQQMQQEQEQQQMAQEPVQQRCGINEDSNINEIAENNNNANIERELHDDANVAQEHPNR
ncbi:hypothetical protein KR222_003653 [Zaprionus bogoriensis]|nr:hypothetical protein KR222_003653 [Zaprionus bogoriensis]